MNRLALSRLLPLPGTRRLWLRLAAGALVLWAAALLGHYFGRLWSGAQPLLELGWRGSVRLPYLAEALGRAGVGLAGASVLLASAFVLGDLAGQALRARYTAWQERLAYSVVLGLGLYANLGLGLALVGLYRPAVLQGLVAGILVYGLWGVWRARARAGGLSARAQPVGAAGRSGRRRPTRAWLWAGAAALAAGLALVAALAPEVEYDAVWFHLNYPRLFLEHGRLVDLPHDYVSLYPMTWELWFGYGLALGGPVAAKLLHFATLPLAAAMVYRLARRHVPGASPWLAVALFATVPTVMWEASTAYIDLALGLHVLLLVYGLLQYASTRRLSWLGLAALNLGLALATKHLALVYLALAGLGLAAWLGAKAWRARQRPLASRLASVVSPLLVFGLVAMLLPLPWYLRAFAASGNPVFPEQYALFGAPAARWDAATEAGLDRFLAHFGPARTLPNLLALPWHLTVHAAAYDGALGPLFLLLLPALALRRPRGATLWLAAFVLGFLALWASPLASFQMRFVIPMVPLLAVLAAAAAGRLFALLRAALGRRAPAVAAGLVGLLLVLNLPVFTPLHEVDRAGDSGWLNSVLRGVPLPVVLGAESQAAYLTRQVRSYAVWDFANAHLPAGARLLTWAGGDQLYAEREWLWANAALARRAAWAPAGQLEFALAELRALGITHLIVDTRPLPAGDSWSYYALTSGEAVRGGHLREVFSARGYTLYALAPVRAGGRP